MICVYEIKIRITLGAVRVATNQQRQQENRQRKSDVYWTYDRILSIDTTRTH